MPRVDVSINGRSYQIACDEGQEDHLVQLAEFVESRVSELVAAVGQVGDARLLVMASLLIADELYEQANGDAMPLTPSFDEDALAGAIESVAERVEVLAAEIEQR